MNVCDNRFKCLLLYESYFFLIIASVLFIAFGALNGIISKTNLPASDIWDSNNGVMNMTEEAIKFSSPWKTEKKRRYELHLFMGILWT